MAEILHQLILVYPIVYRVSDIQGGCLGFLNINSTTATLTKSTEKILSSSGMLPMLGDKL